MRKYAKRIPYICVCINYYKTKTNFDETIISYKVITKTCKCIKFTALLITVGMQKYYVSVLVTRL